MDTSSLRDIVGENKEWGCPLLKELFYGMGSITVSICFRLPNQDKKKQIKSFNNPRKSLGNRS